MIARRALQLAGPLLVVFALLITSASAQSMHEKKLGTFGSWKSFSYNEGGQTVCYMVTTKVLKPGALSKRSTPYLMITHRPVEASTDVVSYGAGLLLNSRHDVWVHIGKNSFDMFSVRDTAWVRDARVDHKLAAAIRLSSLVEVSAVPLKRGTKPLKDQFDTTGAAAASHAIARACGLAEEKPAKSPALKKKPVKKKVLATAAKAKSKKDVH